MKGKLSFKGDLRAKKIKAKRVHHWLQDIKVAWQLFRYRLGSKISGQLSGIGTLRVRKFNSLTGRWENHGIVGVNCITDTGVAALVDDWHDDSKDITSFNWHDSGTGVGGELAGDTGLGTPCGEARDSGTKSQPSANVLQSVATHTYAGGFAITEHGLFDANAAGVMWDRTVFGEINVEASDKIEFTYQCTITAGG